MNFFGPIGAGTTVAGLLFKFGEKMHELHQTTFRLRNDMQHVVEIECRDKNNCAERKKVQPGEYYTVDIWPTVSTHWWCNVWPWLNSDELTTFVIHHGHDRSHTFALTYGGIEKMDLDGSNHHFFMKWAGH